ncbi:hypothetical protein [Erythrobacter alti]|uniref:hypothetical protein n=1 Tax=Erythrobacter alti TaxID=1896145 RepID=UPI0030F3868E
MKNVFLAAAIASAPLFALTAPVAAQQITVTAPSDLDGDEQRDWERLERQANRLAERIVDRQGTVLDEQREVANAQERLARAEANLREEERELERATDRLAQAREELDRVEDRMLAMGGQRVDRVAITD